MKFFWSFILLLISQSIFACICGHVKLLERYMASDFVATAKILNVTQVENSSYHHLEIEIIELYKGKEIKELRLNSRLNTSCSLYTPPNTEWLIFAYENEDGILSFGYCSGSTRIDRVLNSTKYPSAQKNYNKSIERKITYLSELKKLNLSKELNEFSLSSYLDNSCLDDFKGCTLAKNDFAIFEITVNKDLSIKNINPIKSFGKEKLMNGLQECLYQNLRINNKIKSIDITGESKIIFGLYYFSSPTNEFKSFIGQFAL